MAAAMAPAVFGNVPEQKPRNWSSHIYGGATMRAGNTEESAYRYGGLFECGREGVYRGMMRFDGRYRKTNRVVSESRNEVGSELRRMFGKKWFAAGTATGLHDDAREIRYRIIGGPAAGRYLYDTDVVRLDVSSGFVYLHETTDVTRRDTVDWRAAQQFRWKITETLECWTNSELLVNLDETDNYRATIRAGIDNRITKHFSLVVSILNEYDNLPDNEELKKNDFEVTTGVRYTF